MSSANYYWYVIIFRIKMLNSKHKYRRINQTDSPIHSLIANEIFAPMIEKFQEDIRVWRFHRSFHSAKDSHPFRLKFYAVDGMQSKITKYVKSHTLYQKLKKEDLLYLKPGKDVICEKLTTDTAIKDDNDPQWSDEIKEIWPYYIHGVSRAWLRMIQVFADKEKSLPQSSFEENLDFYDRINRLIEQQWVKWGLHAMLHHLNAVFGYKHIDVHCVRGDIMNIEPVLFTKNENIYPGISAKIRF
ncbi:MAG: hypothetical protein KAV87_30005 [Desulfobacteraceae bacterium]|nr:hypothetical protein [Desulfobacteraceae bacterium]